MSEPRDYDWLIERLIRLEADKFYGDITMQFRSGEMYLFRTETTEANPMQSSRKNRNEENAHVRV